jgi:hypothetical protein
VIGFRGYSSVAASLKIGGVILKLLMGHAMGDVTERYIWQDQLGVPLFEAQRRLSAKLATLVGV